MNNHNVGIRKRRAGPGKDIVSRLPPELVVAILEELNGVELTRVPNVCQSWRSFFARKSMYEPCFRAAIRDRFGSHVPTDDPGRVYLALRRETCHLCPAQKVFPFVYVSSNALAITKQKDDPVTLFPVCKTCATTELDKKEFDVVVEEAHVSFVCPRLPQGMLKEKEDQNHRCKGFMYSDTSRFKGTSCPLDCLRLSSLRGHFQGSLLQ